MGASGCRNSSFVEQDSYYSLTLLNASRKTLLGAVCYALSLARNPHKAERRPSCSRPLYSGLAGSGLQVHKGQSDLIEPNTLRSTRATPRKEPLLPFSHTCFGFDTGKAFSVPAGINQFTAPRPRRRTTLSSWPCNIAELSIAAFCVLRGTST